MRVHDCAPQEHELESVQGSLVTHVRLDGGCVASVGGPGFQVTAEGATRGEAVLLLADTLKSLGYELARKAFELYGAVHIPR